MKALPAPQGLAQLEIVYENGQKHIIATDHSWKGTTKGVECIHAYQYCI